MTPTPAAPRRSSRRAACCSSPRAPRQTAAGRVRRARARRPSRARSSSSRCSPRARSCPGTPADHLAPAVGLRRPHLPAHADDLRVRDRSRRAEGARRRPRDEHRPGEQGPDAVVLHPAQGRQLAGRLADHVRRPALRVSRSFSKDTASAGYALTYLDIPKKPDGSSRYPGPFGSAGRSAGATNLIQAAVTCSGDTITYRLSEPVADFGEVVSTPSLPRQAQHRQGRGLRLPRLLQRPVQARGRVAARRGRHVGAQRGVGRAERPGARAHPRAHRPPRGRRAGRGGRGDHRRRRRLALGAPRPAARRAAAARRRRRRPGAERHQRRPDRRLPRAEPHERGHAQPGCAPPWLSRPTARATRGPSAARRSPPRVVAAQHRPALRPRAGPRPGPHRRPRGRPRPAHPGEAGEPAHPGRLPLRRAERRGDGRAEVRLGEGRLRRRARGPRRGLLHDDRAAGLGEEVRRLLVELGRGLPLGGDGAPAALRRPDQHHERLLRTRLRLPARRRGQRGDGQGDGRRRRRPASRGVDEGRHHPARAGQLRPARAAPVDLRRRPGGHRAEQQRRLRGTPEMGTIGVAR